MFIFYCLLLYVALYSRIPGNPATDNAALLIAQDLRKIVTRLEVVPSVTSGMCTEPVTLSWVIQTLLSPLRYYNGFRRSQDA